MSYGINEPIQYTSKPVTKGFLESDHDATWTFDDGTNASGISVSKQWSTVGNHSATVNVTNRITGGQASASKVIELDTFQWTNYGPTSSLPVVQNANPGYALIGTKLYVFGVQSTLPSNGLAIYDFSTDTWAATRTMPLSYNETGSAGMNIAHKLPVLPSGKVYLGERNYIGPGDYTRNPHLYNPTDDTYQQLLAMDGFADIPLPLDWTGSPYPTIFNTDFQPLNFAVGDDIYAFGGSINGAGITGNVLFKHVISTNKWKHVLTFLPSVSTDAGFAGVIHQFEPGKFFYLPIPPSPGNAYIINVLDGTYRISVNQCGLSSDMNCSLSAVQLLDGDMFITGGALGFSGENSKQYRFNLSTLKFTEVASNPAIRTRPGMFRMADGRVHIVNGCNSPYTSIIYDPVANTHSSTYSMGTNQFRRTTIAHPINGKPVALDIWSSGTPIRMSIFSGK